jgi:hypothetical protein
MFMFRRAVLLLSLAGLYIAYQRSKQSPKPVFDGNANGPPPASI